MPVTSKAGEQNPLVVVGLSPAAVAISYPTPSYPADCERMRIQGTVEVRIWVHNGKMVKVKGASANPLLAGKSARWIHRNWQFKPNTTGVYVLPIIYQLG
jgi:TonB family protein